MYLNQKWSRSNILLSLQPHGKKNKIKKKLFIVLLCPKKVQQSVWPGLQAGWSFWRSCQRSNRQVRSSCKSNNWKPQAKIYYPKWKFGLEIQITGSLAYWFKVNNSYYQTCTWTRWLPSQSLLSKKLVNWLHWLLLIAFKIWHHPSPSLFSLSTLFTHVDDIILYST